MVQLRNFEKHHCNKIISRLPANGQSDFWITIVIALGHSCLPYVLDCVIIVFEGLWYVFILFYLSIFYRKYPYSHSCAQQLISFFFSQKPVADLLTSYGLPLSDGALLDRKGVMFIGLHTILYTIALVIVRVYALVTHMVLSALGAVMRVLFHK